MKTKNNVQKAIFKSLAVVISLVLISFTVNAQGFWKTLLENNSLNEIAMFMVESNHENSSTLSKDINTDAVIEENETEESLSLEEWMTSSDYFQLTNLQMEEATESPLALEPWMTSDNYFITGGNTLKEMEHPLELEKWMTDANYFSTNTILPGRDVENKLTLKNWMVANNYWNR